LCVASIGARAETPVDAGPVYLLQAGDVLLLDVWKEKELQAEVLIRPDGGISFPLAGDVPAAGRSVEDLRADLETRLKHYIPDAVVTVGIKTVTGNRVYVIGKVNHPGDYMMVRETDVTQAIALAGGTTPFADTDGIKVLRRDNGRQSVFSYHYTDIEQGRRLEQNIVLRGGDTVVVP
jgi:polysaccharide export outer membrane protein